ncbi:MAG: hypothetical protein GY696_02105 [Gammaproteobacteria bacterium]|nr:hypothetical protein [Gammaproteobacteria bacterium]
MNYFQRNPMPRIIPIGDMFHYLRRRVHFLRLHYFLYGLRQSQNRVDHMEILLFDRLFFMGCSDPIMVLQSNDMLVQLLVHILRTLENDSV